MVRLALIVVSVLAVSSLGCSKSAKLRPVGGVKTAKDLTPPEDGNNDGDQSLNDDGDDHFGDDPAKTPTTPTPTQPEQDEPAVVVTPQPQLPSQPKQCLVDCPSQEIEVPPSGETCSENQKCPRLPQKPSHCAPQPVRLEREKPKMDILFVVDASASLRGGKYKGTGGELGAIARELGSFLKPLNDNMDYQIGVMLGHGPKSALHGRVFSAGKKDPAVIHFNLKQLTDQEMNKNRLTKEQAHEKIFARYGQILENKVLQMPKDPDKDAQGEALLLGVYNGVKQGHLSRLVRPDADLTVIFISDEQDPCFDYAANPGVTPVLVPVKDAKGNIRMDIDPPEKRFFAGACATAVNGRTRLTPDHVYDALASLKTGRTLIVTGILYTQPNVPNATQDENEQGRGFLDVIHRAKFDAVDLAKVQAIGGDRRFMDALYQLGASVKAKTSLSNDKFPCHANVNPASIESSSVIAHILDNRGKEIGTYRAKAANKSERLKWTVEIDRGGKKSVGWATIDDKQGLANLLDQHQVDQGTVEIEYMLTEEAWLATPE